MGGAQALHRAGRLYRVEISQKSGEERRGLHSLLALLGVAKGDQCLQDLRALEHLECAAERHEEELQKT